MRSSRSAKKADKEIQGRQNGIKAAMWQKRALPLPGTPSSPRSTSLRLEMAGAAKLAPKRDAKTMTEEKSIFKERVDLEEVGKKAAGP